MARFLDSYNKPLRKGFYKHFDEDQLFYFTGNYNPNRNDIPLFNNENNDVNKFVTRAITYANFTKNLSKVAKKEVKEIVKMISKRNNFLEKSLEDLKKQI